jgi:hypothetical protein
MCPAEVANTVSDIQAMQQSKFGYVTGLRISIVCASLKRSDVTLNSKLNILYKGLGVKAEKLQTCHKLAIYRRLVVQLLVLL